LRFTKFDNDVEPLAFADLLPRFPAGAEVMLHIPEFQTVSFGSDCLPVYRSRPDLKWRFNILLQNIDAIPSSGAVELLSQVGTTTATTAHKAYASDDTASRIGCPLHHLSTWVCPEDYQRLGYFQKQKLIVVSPDPHPARAEILRQMSEALPDHRIVKIWDMTYQEYRNIIKVAKFTFTFGEGLDGYFTETIFSGGIAMALFNDRFFTEDYWKLDGIFKDGQSAISNVAQFLKEADNAAQFEAIAARQYSVSEKNYSRAEYIQNIKSYYEKYFE
jgi:hypothetical protein